MYKTDELQNMLIEFLDDNELPIEALRSKDDLTRTGTKPLSYIQFVGNRYTKGIYHTFHADFNLYFVDKSLSNGIKSELLELLDKARGLLIGVRIDYEPFVTKETPVIIDSENYTETKSSVFVYTMNISIKVGIKNAKS